MSSEGTEETDASSVYSYYSEGSEGPVPCSVANSIILSESVNFCKEESGSIWKTYLTKEEKEEIIALSETLLEDSQTIFPREARCLLEKLPSVTENPRLIPGSLVFLCETLSRFIDTEVLIQVPNDVLFEVCAFSPSKPIMLLTFSKRKTPSVSQYNASIARSIRLWMNKEMNMNLACIKGVIEEGDCDDKHLLSEKIEELEEHAKSFAVPVSLYMDQRRCADAVKAFLKMIPLDSMTDLEPDEAERDAVTIGDHNDAVVMYPSQDHGLPDKLRIVLIGKTGSGKSTTGNTITGASSFVSRLSEKPVTRTSEEVPAKRFGTSLTVVDTPTFWLSIDDLNSILPDTHIVLFVTRLGRFSHEDIAILHYLKKTFGKGICDHMLVVCTGKDDLDIEKETIECYVRRSSSDQLRTLVTACGDRFVAVNNRAPEGERDAYASELLTAIKGTIKANGGKVYTPQRMDRIIPNDTKSFSEDSNKQLRSDKFGNFWSKQTGVADIENFCFQNTDNNSSTLSGSKSNWCNNIFEIPAPTYNLNILQLIMSNSEEQKPQEETTIQENKEIDDKTFESTT